MYGADGEPIMPPYSSFSITMTATCAVGPVERRAGGEGRVWTGSGLVPAPPHAAISSVATVAAISRGLTARRSAELARRSLGPAPRRGLRRLRSPARRSVR